MGTSNDRRNANLSWFAAHPRFVARAWPHAESGVVTYDARHVYVEQFWLPVLGPSAVLALRRFADWLDGRPAGVQVDLVDLGSSLGLGSGTGRHTQINRTLGRLIDYRIAQIRGDHLEVLAELPPVPPQLRRRLPPRLMDALTEHERRCLSGS